MTSSRTSSSTNRCKVLLPSWSTSVPAGHSTFEWRRCNNPEQPASILLRLTPHMNAHKHRAAALLLNCKHEGCQGRLGWLPKAAGTR